MASRNSEWSDLPEVTSGPHSGTGSPWQDAPEVIHDTGLHPVEPKPGTYHLGMYGGDAVPVAKPWWRRKWIWILTAIVVLIIIAVVVGTTVGLRKQTGGSSDSPGSPSSGSSPTGTAASVFGTPTSFAAEAASSATACKGTICPQTLAVAKLPSDSSFFLFVIGSDKALWYRQAHAEPRWAGDWSSLGGTFKSQPAATSVSDGRIDVFAIWEDGTMRTKTYQNGAWDRDWTSLGGDCYAPPTVCSMEAGRMDLFTISDQHDLARKVYEGGKWTKDWEITQGFISGSPTATCGGPDRMDVTVYGGFANPYDVVFKRWNGTAFSDWTSRGGGYRGDPSAVALGPERTDFLGIDPNAAMWHIKWTTTGGFVQSNPLGGMFQSTATMVWTGGDKGRIDALAIGQDGTLQHKALKETTWGTSWENLGGVFNSAPLAVTMKDGSAVVFGIAPGGAIIHSTFKVGDGYSWDQGKWFSDGGAFTSSWFRSGPA